MVPTLISQVNESIYIGSLLSIRELQKLRSHQTSWLVVSVVHSEPMRNLVLDQLCALREHRPDIAVKHVEYALQDQVNEVLVSLRLEEVLKEMDGYIEFRSSYPLGAGTEARTERRHQRACLVHCAMGVSRSASVVAAWLMTRSQHSLEAALELIRRARPTAQPNAGFIAGLRAIEQCHSVEGAIRRLERKRVTRH